MPKGRWVDDGVADGMMARNIETYSKLDDLLLFGKVIELCRTIMPKINAKTELR
jgi:hypothetical protein